MTKKLTVRNQPASVANGMLQRIGTPMSRFFGGFLSVFAFVFALSLGATKALAVESAAATAGGAAITSLVGDVNYLGAIFITVVAALAVWNLVSHFLGKKR